MPFCAAWSGLPAPQAHARHECCRWQHLPAASVRQAAVLHVPHLAQQLARHAVVSRALTFQELIGGQTCGTTLQNVQSILRSILWRTKCKILHIEASMRHLHEQCSTVDAAEHALKPAQLMLFPNAFQGASEAQGSHLGLCRASRIGECTSLCSYWCPQ